MNELQTLIILIVGFMALFGGLYGLALLAEKFGLIEWEDK